MLSIEPTGQSCGAIVSGLDLGRPLDAETVRQVRAAWLDHHVLVFPDQRMDNEDLVRFAEYFGPIGDDPFFKPIPGHDRIAAIQRRADENSPLFADALHSDWSFMARPPSGTCLFGITIPPVGGDTIFSNQHLALDRMPDEMRARIADKVALHSPRGAYGVDGKYTREKYEGSMAIRTSLDAHFSYGHDMIRAHPETGRPGLFGGSYVVGFEEISDSDGEELRQEIRQWQGREEFHYRHEWQPNMLVLWDNRSVLHQATGGYEGYDRLLHRLTVADDDGYHLQQ